MDTRTIVFVESTALMGGVEFSTLYLAQYLDPRRWRPLVICPDEGDLTMACRRAGIPVAIIPRPPMRSTSFRLGRERRLPNPPAWLWDLGVVGLIASRLAHALGRIRPDLVVTKGIFSHLYGGLAARRRRIPCIWHVQDFISERFGGIYPRAMGLMATWLADYIIVDGTPIARQLPERLKSRMAVVHNGVDTRVFRPGLDGAGVRHELGLPQDARVIGHVARMTPWKGQHYLLEAFAHVAERVPDAYLLYVGAPVFDSDAYEQSLRTQAATLGLSQRVVFAGYRHDLPRVLAAMNIFAHTSVEKDTSPLALLSAMASGLPIVAFDIEGIREMLTDGEEAIVVPARRVEALAQALVQLLQQDDLRARLAQRARQRAETAFSLVRYGEQMERIFLNVLDGFAR